MSEGSNKCVECVSVAVPCDLTPLDTKKWKRLKERRRKLKIESREARVKWHRLKKQIDLLKEQQQEMVDAELRNIEELEQEKFQATLLSLNPVVDVVSKQIVLFTVSGGWSLTSFASVDETPSIVSGSQSNS